MWYDTGCQQPATTPRVYHPSRQVTATQAQALNDTSLHSLLSAPPPAPPHSVPLPAPVCLDHRYEYYAIEWLL
ncbi:hypothetical protein PAXRUDRAFT_822011 [Paxillus rubicundulus Ve08.2h10]|uniref:Uncharacterized protein n=1 Tax=Paxillus rubicundulus Ve08.2h10 TaxID=930991 RepID=A0A0D0EA96_9AGAM|nr:hypothetical protein PAXRUDRAFT_822011 [Paxillus rubicundulus Ve08.2h10]